MGWTSLIGAGIGAIGSVVGGLIGSEASEDAANIGASAEENTMRMQLDYLRQVRGDIADAVEKGLIDLEEGYGMAGIDFNAMAEYISLIQDPSAIEDRPSYNYFRDQGMDALSARASTSSGGGVSGSSMKAMQEYGQNYAASALDRELARLEPIINAKIGLGTAKANLRAGGASGQAGLAGLGVGAMNTSNFGAWNAMNQGNIWGSVAEGIGNQASSMMNLAATRPELFSS